MPFYSSRLVPALFLFTLLSAVVWSQDALELSVGARDAHSTYFSEESSTYLSTHDYDGATHYLDAKCFVTKIPWTHHGAKVSRIYGRGKGPKITFNVIRSRLSSYDRQLAQQQAEDALSKKEVKSGTVMYVLYSIPYTTK